MQLKLIDLFESIRWAKNGDLTDFSQTNYEAGWAYLGDDTPTVQDFNYVQAMNDQKDQWLFAQINEVLKAQGIEATEEDLPALKRAIENLVTAKSTPKTITAETQNGFDESGHTHEIDRATTAKAGIVQLSNDDNSDDETKAPTLKAIKKLKGLYDGLRRLLDSYIPNSKKSNAVNSPSSDTIATSAAAKTAYDKGAEAKNAADNANNNANRRAFGLALSSEDLNSITASGIYGQHLDSNSISARHYPIQQAGKLIVTGSSGFGAQQLYITYHDNHIYARGKNQNGWSDWKRIDGLNGVSKSGDTMTGNLVIDTDDSLLKGKRSGVNKYAVGLRNSTSNDVVVLNYTDNTSIELLANSVYSNKTLVAPGMILEDSDWTGLNIKNLSGRYVRFEGNPHSATNMLTIMYREANGTNINTVSLRKKGGTLALLEDFTYQKIGNFEVRRYPDGTMIQTYFAEFNDIFGANSGLGGSGQKQLTWAAAFVGKPIVFGNITTSLEENHNAGVNILTKSTNTTLYWYNYESGSANQRLCRLQFLAIGRWR
ncbi:tail fiber protein [Rodentibacter caecimuris]|uniref:tail fiber protein n=1 Tax=Rodentibacter caecimuris TaxID=1796644 RepID=UPI002249597A|nr:tail fiber protein [Rodentibacter heylii]MCX2960281.1 pyocin knob domain-containing protein [Rodentibacter heylii]